MKRKAISKKLRFDVFKRDGFVCQYCGTHPPAVILHVDHIVPVAEGGENRIENLITACEGCNLGKGARSLTTKPPTNAFNVELAREREEQAKGYAELMSAMRARVEKEAWDVAIIFADQFSKESIRKDWFQSIKQFVEKIGSHECIRAMEIACAKKPWSADQAFRYFCGICWNIVKGPQP